MFKKNHPLFLSLIIGLQLSLPSCSKKEADFNIVELTLDKSAVALTPGNNLSVNIETGNGEYTAVSSNTAVAKAAVSGNVITITAVTNEDRANTVVVVTDKMFKRKSIDVTIAKVFDLSLSKNEADLEVGVPGKNEGVIAINTGNFGYKTELMDNSAQFIEIDKAKLESHAKFTIKAIAPGIAKVKVTDALGKEAIIE